MLEPVKAPVTPNVPATVALTSTSKVSIWAVPSINKSLNSKEDVPKSTSLSVTGETTQYDILICYTAALETSTKTPQRLFVLSATILFKKSWSPIV